MKKIFSVLSVIVFVLVFSSVSFAAQSSGTLTVQATVVASCTVSSNTVDFGTTTTNGNVAYANGGITVNCPNGTPYKIALDVGSHFSNGNRNIASNSYKAHYELFLGGPNNFIWGDPCAYNTYGVGTNCVSDTGTGADQAHTVYGTLNPLTGIPAGTALTDTVQVTVVY